jgi:hypothetical protein
MARRIAADGRLTEGYSILADEYSAGIEAITDAGINGRSRIEGKQIVPIQLG